VAVLLEVVGQREVQERPARGDQLHGRGQAALDDGQVARREVAVEVVDVRPDLQAVVHAERGGIDPSSLPRRAGTRVRGFVPDLFRTLAACDVAIVQGGLTTCMELAAARRPFLYVPLENHFEQNFHVQHRLARYGAGRGIRYIEAADPAALAAALVAEVSRRIDYRRVETDGAARAAAMLAELI
jgi:UDP:flavonoid glycosyltransferase YjiC (YdhE family)